MPPQLLLKITNNSDELATITEAVEGFGEEQDWPMDLVFKVNLALEELSLNVINYGHEPDSGEHEIEITLTSSPDALTIEIADDGRPFDPLSEAPLPDTEAPVEDRDIGGLGIHLVRNMMDEMSYRREADRNILTMTARRG